MKKNDRSWNATRRYIGRVLTGILHKPTTVHEARPGELGYTSEDGPIYIAKEHPLFDSLTSNEKLLVQLGIAVHEAMHKIFTNNLYLAQTYERLMSEKKFSGPFEANMYLNLFNLIEDPAIEMHAHEKTGGTALKALYFAIEKIDELSGAFQNGTSHPMQELCSALVQFGDMGILNGEFNFPEAKSVFAKIAPIFYDAINEPDNKKRVDYTEAIFDECKVLWENDRCLEQEQLLKLINSILADLLKGNAVNNLTLSGEGENASDIPENDPRNRKRRISIRKVAREEFERLKEESEGSEVADDGISDIEIVIPDDDVSADQDTEGTSGSVPVPVPSVQPQEGEETDGNEESSSNDEADAPDNSGTAPSDADEEPDLSTDQPSFMTPDFCPPEESISSDSSETTPEQDSIPVNVQDDPVPTHGDTDFNGTSSQTSYDTYDDIEEYDADDDLYSEGTASVSITEEEFENILNGIDRECQRIDAEEAEYKEYYGDIESFDDKISDFPDFESVKAENLHALDIDDSLSDRYDKILDKLSVYIEPLKDELENIFIADRVKKLFTESGKVYLPRLSGKKTTRVFRRKLQPDHKDDVCFVIAVDNSGSTSGDKNLQEIYSCIGIAEAFKEFDIPLYIFGFNVEHIAVQTHFVRWENTRFEREHLLCMQADGCNFDSYSIRYATELLKSRTEKNKVLIVISDGCPSYYFNNIEGILQNSKAIEDARSENIHVLGIGVGDVDDDCFFQMYSKDYYIKVNKPADLFDNLADRLVKFIDTGN